MDSYYEYHVPRKDENERNEHRFACDYNAPVLALSLIVYQKLLPNQQLLRIVEEEGADAWWNDHLVQIHLSPQPSSSEAHFTLVLEGTRESLGYSTGRSAGIFERPLLYFHPKRQWQRRFLEPALRKGFGPKGEGFTVTQDKDRRDIWVVLRPPFVTEEDITRSGQIKLRLLYTYVFRNPGRLALRSALKYSSRFRILFRPDQDEVYVKFQIQHALATLI
jgi:hypothetical protein